MVSNTKTVQKQETQPKLEELYKEIKDTLGAEKIPNLFTKIGDYEIARWVWHGFKDIMLRDSSIPRSLKEAIGVVVSKNNSCGYCVDAHNLMLNAIGYDSNKIGELNQDYKSSSHSEKEKTVFDFALKLSNESYKITEKDHQNLKKHGFTEQQILEIITVASLHNFVNRFVDALGIQFEMVKG